MKQKTFNHFCMVHFMTGIKDGKGKAKSHSWPTASYYEHHILCISSSGQQLGICAHKHIGQPIATKSGFGPTADARPANAT